MNQCEELKDDDGPSNTLEYFTELEEVLKMIDNLKISHAKNFEKEYEKFSEILTRYQEQPHLLDPHLDKLISHLLAYIHDSEKSETLLHSSFKYLYTLCKVRTFKAMVKFLPHELCDLEFALELLENQDINDSQNWETRYILLLWMSILVLNPFHMSRLDAVSTPISPAPMNHVQGKTKMERIFDLCKRYCENKDTCSNVAAFLAAKYFVRTDIKDIYLEKFLNWIMEKEDSQTADAKFGQLAAVSAILKHGKREDLLVYADTLLRWILSSDYKTSSDFLKYKHYIKIVQRLGLVYLKPRLASWRYKRGSRSLTANLGQGKTENLELKSDSLHDDDGDDDIAVPDAIEDIIEELLQGLRSVSSDIRWSAAKGLGRVTNRLPKTLGDEVVGSVIDMFSPLEPHEAWHGACLAIAELAKRGLLLTHRLKAMVPLLMQALVYDEIKGYMSVGQHIRDSACYMCWAFARAYDPKDLEPFVNQIAAGLLITAVFDREINCRRAAAAAFQESVGRLGNFPYGIEISTTTDFYTVGLRMNSYLIVSDSIAQYEEYTKPLIDHLVSKKVNHWDNTISELTAKTLNKLTKRDPMYMSNEILPTLFSKVDSIDMNMRRGAILAIGEITLALSELEASGNIKGKLITNDIISELNNLVIKFQKKELFRGFSGEKMKQCCCDFISNCSRAKIEASPDCLESWQQIIDKSIINKNAQIRDSATTALADLCKAYYDSPERNRKNCTIVESYIKGADNDLEEHVRMGYVSALGSLPKFMLQPKLSSVIDNLVKHSLLPEGALKRYLSGQTKVETENSITNSWAEARRDGVKSLANVVQTIGFDSKNPDSFANMKYFKKLMECYLKALQEYTLDNRGDIGAWVREASMTAIHQAITTCPTVLLDEVLVHTIMTDFGQQAVEKIDRTRGLAGKLFCNLLYTHPPIPHIRQHKRLKEIFPEDSSTVLWLFADHTFPLFCAMLELKDYSERLILGLSASMGQLTESLIKYSSTAFFNFLRSHPEEVPRICSEIVAVFEKQSLNERVTYPMLNFLDLVLSSGTISNVLLDENNDFAEEIFRLVNLEIKGQKKLYKLASSVNVFCQLIQVPRLSMKILSKMSVFLGLTHVHIRKTTATKLYEALALYGDVCGISDDNIDVALTILSETDWGMPLTEVRPIRNQLCDLIGVKPPVNAAVAGNTTSVIK